MLFNASPLLAYLFLNHALSSPYPFPNSTATPPNTTSNDTMPVQPSPLNSSGIPQYECHEVYPSNLTVLNARYPDYDEDHLHRATQFFMLRRQLGSSGEISTLVQFTDLPNSTSNYTCRLEFVLPRPELQLIQGTNPSFNVWQVASDVGAVATWNEYSQGGGKVLYGTVNGEEQALNRTSSVGGVAAVNETACNETMSFQMGMMYDSVGDAPNYWEFLEVAPPAWPVQGFRVVYGC
jgi:hypothetical protein